MAVEDVLRLGASVILAIHTTWIKSKYPQMKQCIIKILFIKVAFGMLCCHAILAQEIPKHLVVYSTDFEKIQPISYEYRDTLTMDVFLPQDTRKNFPCVIMVSAFSKFNFRKSTMYKDWAKFMATNGMAVVIYEAPSPGSDFDALYSFILDHSVQLRIDTARLALWSCSANSLLAINKASQKQSFKAQVIYYGLTATGDSKHKDEIKAFCDENGIYFYLDNDYKANIATQIVRAGNDSWPLIQKCIKEFSDLLLSKNIPFELINYPQGHHNFDVVDNAIRSQQIINQTIAFLRTSLTK